MKIRDVMTTEVQTVSPDQTVKEAASFMLNSDTGSIPVRDGGQLIGIITDRDIAVRGVAEGLGPETAVRELMSEDVVCARDDDEVSTVARRMSEAQVRRLPVLNADGNLVGIVSLGDLSREASDVAASRALEGISAAGGQHQQ
ncbi:MAG TPA: CBS domain-containing protein [Sphingomicrobium sp.]|nr:CBS domain-containing protein [Sphingomicrobium sp.]